MRYAPSLIQGTLIKRYKRFLADIELASGEVITAHCPNTGSMKNCCDPSSRVWVYDANNPKRKLRYTWELVEVESRYLACINTGRANHLVKEAILAGDIPELSHYETLKTECKYGQENSRIDILLSADGKPDCYVEVKNVTLLEENNRGSFPDAVTTRGTKHLRELMEMKSQGARAVLFFNVAHTGISSVRPNWLIDPIYTDTLEEAINHGVEVLAYGASISDTQIHINNPIPFSMNKTIDH